MNGLQNPQWLSYTIERVEMRVKLKTIIKKNWRKLLRSDEKETQVWVRYVRKEVNAGRMKR